jgi:hypothetical protein
MRRLYGLLAMGAIALMGATQSAIALPACTPPCSDHVDHYLKCQGTGCGNIITGDRYETDMVHTYRSCSGGFVKNNVCQYSADAGCCRNANADCPPNTCS